MLKIQQTFTDIYGTLHHIDWDNKFIGTLNVPNDKTQSIELKTNKKITNDILLKIQKYLYIEFKRNITADNYGEKSRYPIETTQIDPFSIHSVTVIKMGKNQSLDKAKERAQMLANMNGLYIKLFDYNGNLVDKIIPRQNPFTGKPLKNYTR